MATTPPPEDVTVTVELPLAHQVHQELEQADEWPDIYLEHVDGHGGVTRRLVRSWYWYQRNTGSPAALVLSAAASPPVAVLLDRVAEQADSLTPDLAAAVRAAVSSARRRR
jgi:hypothetical protein